MPRLAGASVAGRVVIVQRGPNEPMDFDPWRWVAIPSWGLILLVSPVLLTIFLWQSYGLLHAVAFGACFLVGLRFLFSNRLLQSWRLTAAMNGRRVVEPMPVTIARVRQWDRREVQMKLKGQLIGGSLVEGDRIAASGKWRSGVLHASRVNCERTGATIIPKQPSARFSAAVALAVLLLSFGWLYFAGLPWVSHQVTEIQSAVHQKVSQFNQSTYRP